MRKVFFSFHYDDTWRVQRVINSQVVKMGYGRSFLSPQAWEKVKRQNPVTIKQWIKEQMHGTSVTVVLVGTQTATRPYVLHEIRESIRDGKGILAVDIHKMKDHMGHSSSRGLNPLAKFFVETEDFLGTPRKVRASAYCDRYDWVADNGRLNIGDWIEEAAEQAGR